jgi:hypothetical protein
VFGALRQPIVGQSDRVMSPSRPHDAPARSRRAAEGGGVKRSRLNPRDLIELRLGRGVRFDGWCLTADAVPGSPTGSRCDAQEVSSENTVAVNAMLIAPCNCACWNWSLAEITGAAARNACANVLVARSQTSLTTRGTVNFILHSFLQIYRLSLWSTMALERKFNHFDPSNREVANVTFAVTAEFLHASTRLLLVAHPHARFQGGFAQI